MRQHFTNKESWKRGLYMLLFALLYSLAEIVVAAVAFFQFIAVLITGEPNQRLLSFGYSLSGYIAQILRFVTYNSELKPYPFTTWPKGAPRRRKAEPAKPEVLPPEADAST